MSRATWYRLGKPTEPYGLMKLTVGIKKQLEAAKVASQLRWGPSRRTLQRIARIQRLDPALAEAVLTGEVTAGVAERWLLERPMLVTAAGVVIPPHAQKTTD